MTSSQITEQIEVTQKLVLPGISNLNNPDLDKKEGNPTQFSAKKTLEKRK